MPRIGSRLPAQLGTFNPASPAVQRKRAPSIQVRGPAFPTELFTADEIPPNVRRALLQLQNNVRQSFSQVRGFPLAYSNVLLDVALTQGGSNGATPNVLEHGLDVPATGYALLSTVGGFITAHALIPGAVSPNLIQVWTQFTAFAGVSSVTANILVWS